VTLKAPASAYRVAHCSGSTIMRWQSKGEVVTARSAITSSSPIV
jgi:hypothetical protein